MIENKNKSILHSKEERFDFPCTRRYGFLVDLEPYQHTTYLDLVAKCDVFAWVVHYKIMWTTFGKSNFLWAIFKSFMIALEQEVWMFLWDILKHSILEFGG